MEDRVVPSDVGKYRRTRFVGRLVNIWLILSYTLFDESLTDTSIVVVDDNWQVMLKA